LRPLGGGFLTGQIAKFEGLAADDCEENIILSIPC
jgi:hypothetical protein